MMVENTLNHLSIFKEANFIFTIKKAILYVLTYQTKPTKKSENSRDPLTLVN